MRKRIISVLMAAVMLLSLAPTAHAQTNVSAASLDGSRQQAYLQAAVTPSVPSGEKDSVLLPAPGTAGKDGMIEIADQTEMFSVPISETDYYNMLRQGKEELSLSSHIHSHVQPASRQFNMRANYTLPSNWTAVANISRWQWLQNLEVVFDLYAEAEDYPDNYYIDLSEEDDYYDVIMIAVCHGLLEEEAGDPVNPTAPATRDFAAHTLSFCLGSIPEKDSFDFGDSAASQWPEDAQVAVERGWLALSGGSFLPGNALTAEEVSNMLADAEATLADRDMSRESSQYRLADWVIKLPDTVTVTANWDENFNQSLTIEGYTGKLNAGDTFAYEEDGFPMVYGVASVSQNGNILTVVPQNAAEGALLEMEYVGSITPELKPMLLSNSAVQFDTHEYGTVTAGKIYAAKGNSKSSISFNRPISSIPGLNGIKGTLKAVVSDIKIEKKFIGSQKKFSVTGKVEFSCTVSFTAAKCDVHVPMGGVYIGSVAYFGLDLRFKVDATVGFKSSYSFEFGLDHKKGKYDIIKNVSSNKDFAFTLDGKASLTLGFTGKIDFGIIGKVDARVSIGPEGAASYKEYASGNPRKCLTLSAYLYAGFKLSIDFGKLFTYDYSKPFWNEKNSPYRLYEHREDGLVVTECTRGKEAPSSTSGDPEPRAASKFTTPATSRRFSTSSKIANSTGKNNRGESVVIWETEEQEDGSVWITGYNGNAVFLTIPETIDGKTVTGIGDSVFYNCKQIEHISIPDTITHIGRSAFKDTGLQSLTLPSGLESIGSYFIAGTGIEELTIPKTVKSMGNQIDILDYVMGGDASGALEESNVKTLVFEEGMSYIPTFAAQNAKQLSSVTIPESVTQISSYAFSGCESLANIDLPASVEMIGFRALADTGLTNLTLKDGLKEINGCFIAGTGIKSITIPKTVETMCTIEEEYGGWSSGLYTATYGALQGSNIESLVLTSGIPYVPYGAAKNVSTLQEVSIPDTAVIIGAYAFYECENLKTISIPDSVTIVGDLAFTNCVGLDNVVIPDSVTKIGVRAFEGCESLSSLTLSRHLTELSEQAFMGCTALKEVQLPAAIKTIGASCFADTGLTSLVLPAGTEDLGGRFIAGTEIKELTIPNSVKEASTYWSNYMESGYTGALVDSNVETLVFEDGFTALPEYMAREANHLKTVILPEGLEALGECTFMYCAALEKVHIPSTVSRIGTSVFNGCTKLVDVSFGENPVCSAIGSGAFAGCSSLSSIALPDSVLTIDRYAFANCSALESIILSNQLEEIGEYAFSDCTALSTLIIPDSVDYIGSEAFSNCDKLETITIPDSVTRLGSSAFYDCDGLVTVNLGTGLTEIPESCFEHCDSLASIILPHSITEIDSAAFKNCIKLTAVTIPRNTSSISSDAFSYKHKLTIYGVNGTYAETYAKENSITFVGIEKKAQSVQFSADTIEMELYDRKTLALTVTPSDCTDEINWTSSNSEIVSVKENGEVEAKKPGTAVVTVSVGDLTASCEVRVIRLIYGIYLNEYEKSLAVGDTYSIQAYISPDDATYQALQWSSSDESVAAVDQDGVVTAKKVGEATITAKSQDGSDESADCRITVTDVLIDSISLETYVLNMEVSETYPLTAIVSPDNASNKQLHWESSDESVASVTQEGVVTAHKKGEARITVSALDGSGSSDYCNVSVNAANICHNSADLESMHPYDDYSNETWIYQVEGASSITLTFDEQTETEADYDYIEIYNAEGELVGSYSGWELAGETVSVPGDTVKIKLTSDSGYNAWGFKVTEAFATIAGVTTPSDKDMKEAAAITDENTDVVMDVEKQEGEADPADVEKIEKEVDENLEVVSSFDVKMFAVEYDAEGKEISREPITQLNKPVLLTFVTPGEAGKTYQVVRIHVNEKGEVEVTLLPTTDNGDGTVSAESDKFSMYYLMEKKANTESDRLPGDVNDDGQVTLMDLVRLCKYLAGYDVDIHEQNSDVNGDGNVTLMDLVRLCKYLAGYDVVLE